MSEDPRRRFGHDAVLICMNDISVVKWCIIETIFLCLWRLYIKSFPKIISRVFNKNIICGQLINIFGASREGIDKYLLAYRIKTP